MAKEIAEKFPGLERSLTSRRFDPVFPSLGGNARDIWRPTILLTNSSSVTPLFATAMTITPSFMTVIRSLRRRTSGMRWEIKTIPVPAARNPSKMPASRSTSLGSSAEVGSSRINAAGSAVSARAISTICRQPNVLGDIKIAHQPGILVNHRDTEVMSVPRRSQNNVLPAHADPPGIGLQNTGEDPHQRGFAGAILSYQ